MYETHNPIIAAYMRESAEGFKRGAWFAILSIRQPITLVPDQLAQLTNGDRGPLFGHKLDAHAYLEDNAAMLQARVLAADSNAARLAILLEVPGLGIVKSGFVLQLMGYDVACLDTRNIKREKRNPRAFRTDGKPPAKLGKKIARYLREVEGHSAAYWDAWCEDVANVYKTTAEEISGLHLAIVPDTYVPF